MMNDIITLVACYVTNFATLIGTMDNGAPWWVSMVVSIISPIFYFLLKYLFDIMITKAKEKGHITDSQAKDLKSKADDITDDGKVNNSNRKEKK